DFDVLGTDFERMYDSSWGQVRLGVVLADLLEHVPRLRDGGLRVLDAGGGAGRIAIELARLGNEVVLCDPSRAMLDRAESAIRAAGLSDAITVIHAPVQEVRVPPEQRFDVITCHAVIEWLVDPARALV